MAGIAVLPKAPRSLSARVLVWLVLGPALLAASATALYFSSRNDALTAYNSAPACSTFADAVAGKDCRYTTTATVSMVIGLENAVEVYFDVPGRYSPFFTARLPVSETSLTEGDQVQVELWQSK